MNFNLIMENWRRFSLEENISKNQEMIKYLIGEMIYSTSRSTWTPAATKISDSSDKAGFESVADHSDLFKGENWRWTVLSRLIDIRDKQTIGFTPEKALNSILGELKKYNPEGAQLLSDSVNRYKSHKPGKGVPSIKPTIEKGSRVNIDWTIKNSSELNIKTTDDGEKISQNIKDTYLFPTLSMSARK